MKKKTGQGRYFTEIKRITNSLATTKEHMDLRWYDFSYLAQTITTYLRAKNRSKRLSPSEEKFLKSTANFADDSVREEIENFYINPNFQKMGELQTLIKREKAHYESEDYSDGSFDKYRKISADIKAFGATLSATDLQNFTVTAHSNWVTAPYISFSNIIPAYAEKHDITAQELTSIFGDRLVSAYWPVSNELYPDISIYAFLDLVDTEGYWLLDLNQLLTPKADHNITTLTILWLKWFKHEKTFHGFEVQSDAQKEIRAAKKIINLLEQQQYDGAHYELIANLRGLWD